MTTVAPEFAPWDAFIHKEADAGYVPDEDARQKRRASVREHVERYRITEWPQTVRELREQFPDQYPLVRGFEPHWTSPGSAVLWQEQKLLKQSERKGDPSDSASSSGNGQELQERSEGWEPVGPIPIGTASQIATYLKNGLRLRPPGVKADVSVDEDTETAPSVGGPAVRRFFCERHPAQGKLGFPTWKGYIHHCRARSEVPEGPFPAEVLERQSKYKWYCVTHDRGFISEKHAKQHIRNAPVVARQHPTVEQMLVRETSSDDKKGSGIKDKRPGEKAGSSRSR